MENTTVNPRSPAVAARLIGMLFMAMLGIFAASGAQAQSYTYTDSCYVCSDISLVTADCVNPSDGENGETSCTIARFFVAVICRTSPPACMYSCFGNGCNTGGGSGGGGGGTGSGGSTCTSGGACPADCFSCGGSYY
jgi:hypothetical protein